MLLASGNKKANKFTANQIHVARPPRRHDVQTIKEDSSPKDFPDRIMFMSIVNDVRLFSCMNLRLSPYLFYLSAQPANAFFCALRK